VNDLRQNLKSEFQNEDYRYAYAESFLNTKLAAQIKALREARGKTQAEMGCLIGTKQSGFSRFEDVNHRVWKTDTLWKIARALGVRVDVSFETFGSLIDQKERFGRQFLERPDFANDPAFLANDLAHSARRPPYARRIAGTMAQPLLSEVPQNYLAHERKVQSLPLAQNIGVWGGSSGIAGTGSSALSAIQSYVDATQVLPQHPESLGSALLAA